MTEPRNQKRTVRKLAAIMFTDIVGYTAPMSKDEAKALELLQRNRRVLKPLIEGANGEWLKEIGDGTLSTFPSAVEAVNCALTIQRSLKDDPELNLRMKPSVDLGISRSLMPTNQGLSGCGAPPNARLKGIEASYDKLYQVPTG